MFTRYFDALCQVAASYATVAGVRQWAAERFVEAAQACFERIPAVGRLLRDGLLTPAWFRRAVEQTALVDDVELLAFIDAEIAHRLSTMGGLSARRVEDAVAAIVAEHDPDAVTVTREQAKAARNVVVNPLNEDAAELIVTTAAEDAALCKDALDAVIAGVCVHDPRTRGQRRSDAAVARISGVRFGCRCDREDCTADLSDAAVAARCAKIVLHVVVRQETLDPTPSQARGQAGGEAGAQVPAFVDGFGPISAAHARDLAARRDAVCKPLDLGDLAVRMSRPGNRYRPTAVLDTAVRGVFGTCSWAGCDQRAWRCDLDHVAEFDHQDPAGGGPTCACNLNPKCIFHHLLKTFGEGWVDDQIIDANGVFWTEVTTPEGYAVRSKAATAPKALAKSRAAAAPAAARRRRLTKLRAGAFFETRLDTTKQKRAAGRSVAAARRDSAAPPAAILPARARLISFSFFRRFSGGNILL